MLLVSYPTFSNIVSSAILLVESSDVIEVKRHVLLLKHDFRLLVRKKTNTDSKMSSGYQDVKEMRI